MINIFKRIAQAYNKVLSARQESNRRQHMEAIRRSFYVDEKDDVVYIMHNGMAVWSFKGTCSVAMITEQLDSMRRTAITHEYGEKLCTVKQ